MRSGRALLIELTIVLAICGEFLFVTNRAEATDWSGKWLLNECNVNGPDCDETIKGFLLGPVDKGYPKFC